MNAQLDLASLLGGAILPSPAWRRHWLATLFQQQVPFDELAEQLGCDPALTGKVIGLANGAVPPGARQHAAVDAAMLAAIGLPALRQAFAIPDRPTATCAHFDEQRFWAHSQAMACAARVLGLDGNHMETLLRHSNAEWSEWRAILEPHAHIALGRTRSRIGPTARQVFSEFI